jgi:hypothetical protein
MVKVKGFPRKLDIEKHPGPGPDVTAYQRTVSRAGRWPWGRVLRRLHDPVRPRRRVVEGLVPHEGRTFDELHSVLQRRFMQRRHRRMSTPCAELLTEVDR